MHRIIEKIWLKIRKYAAVPWKNKEKETDIMAYCTGKVWKNCIKWRNKHDRCYRPKMEKVGNPCRVLREINGHDREYYYKEYKIPEELLKLKRNKEE